MSNFNHDTDLPQTLQVFCLKGTEEFLGFIQKEKFSFLLGRGYKPSGTYSKDTGIAVSISKT